jgi:Flp pilus assembly protein TadG
VVHGATTRRRCRGAAALEFALISPLFLAVLFGMIDYGLYFYQRFAISAAVRDGIRAGLGTLSTATPDAWTVASNRATAVLQASNAVDLSRVVFGPTDSSKRYGDVDKPYEKTLTLSAQFTFKPLIGFVPLPSAPVTYSMTMMLELEN